MTAGGLRLTAVAVVVTVAVAVTVALVVKVEVSVRSDAVRCAAVRYEDGTQNSDSYQKDRSESGISGQARDETRDRPGVGVTGQVS